MLLLLWLIHNDWCYAASVHPYIIFYNHHVYTQTSFMFACKYGGYLSVFNLFSHSFLAGSPSIVSTGHLPSTRLPTAEKNTSFWTYLKFVFVLDGGTAKAYSTRPRLVHKTRRCESYAKRLCVMTGQDNRIKRCEQDQNCSPVNFYGFTKNSFGFLYCYKRIRQYFYR